MYVRHCAKFFYAFICSMHTLARYALMAAALLGLTATVAGAVGSHALRSILTAAQLASYETGVRFQFYHALALLVLGWALRQHNGQAALLKGMLGCWLCGTLLFSGSIYAHNLLGWPATLAPVGGILLMLGWAQVALYAYRYRQP